MERKRGIEKVVSHYLVHLVMVNVHTGGVLVDSKRIVAAVTSRSTSPRSSSVWISI